jgi:hypothetical protein
MSTVERILFVALVAAAASAFATLSFVVGLVIIVWLSGLEMTLRPGEPGGSRREVEIHDWLRPEATRSEQKAHRRAERRGATETGGPTSSAIP